MSEEESDEVELENIKVQHSEGVYHVTIQFVQDDIFLHFHEDAFGSIIRERADTIFTDHHLEEIHENISFKIVQDVIRQNPKNTYILVFRSEASSWLTYECYELTISNKNLKVALDDCAKMLEGIGVKNCREVLTLLPVSNKSFLLKILENRKTGSRELMA